LRPDKSPNEIDTLETVKRLAGEAGSEQAAGFDKSDET
jgi:hypothetical protein